MRNVSNYCYVCFLLKTCERYIKNEECFWQCEPNLIKWHVKEGALEGVPVCAKYCDDWFDACKDDFTCAEDWLSDFNYSSNVYSCPTASKCLKFSKVTSSSSSYTLITRGKLEYTMCLFWNISSDALSLIWKYYLPLKKGQTRHVWFHLLALFIPCAFTLMDFGKKGRQ